jgi:hypothetical protein
MALYYTCMGVIYVREIFVEEDELQLHVIDHSFLQFIYACFCIKHEEKPCSHLIRLWIYFLA